MTPLVREQLHRTIETLSDDQAEAVLAYAEALMSDSLPPDYDEANDPSIGFIWGPTDLANRAKDILRDEITATSGWTQKKD
jgi:hypothetical protein